MGDTVVDVCVSTFLAPPSRLNKEGNVNIIDEINPLYWLKVIPITV